MAHMLKTPAPTFVYRAYFPRTDEYLESPDFHTLYKSAFRWVQIQLDDNGENADCVIYKIAGEITALRDGGGIEWRVKRDAPRAIHSRIWMTGNGSQVVVQRFIGGIHQVCDLFLFKARPYHYGRKTVK